MRRRTLIAGSIAALLGVSLATVFLVRRGRGNADAFQTQVVDRGEGWNLMRKSLPDGPPRRLTNFPDGQIVDHGWSKDGSRMVLHRRIGPHDSLWMLKPGEASPTLITEFKTGRLARHYWAPDAPILYFTYGASTQDVVLIGGFR